jgi:hypothetical protein
MTIKLTLDKNAKQATYGIENGVSWIEFVDGLKDRVAFYGNCNSIKARMNREIAARGIAIPETDLQQMGLEPMAA